jgi:hypothetical protein
LPAFTGIGHISLDRDAITIINNGPKIEFYSTKEIYEETAHAFKSAVYACGPA